LAKKNKCKDLEIKDVYKDIHLNNLLHAGDLDDIKDPLQEMLNLQKKLQKHIAKSKPEYQKLFGKDLGPKMTVTNMALFFMFQNQSMLDEQQEELEAIGGERFGNASWKYWKKDHKNAQSLRFIDLSPEEILEAKYEWIDSWHFMMNKAIALGLTSQEITNLYFAKNAENIRRQNENY